MNLYTELMGLKVGLEMAWELGFRRVSCESNSQVAISLANEPLNPFHLYVGTVAKIKQMLASNWEVSIRHVYREANMSVDGLAKHGVMASAHLV